MTANAHENPVREAADGNRSGGGKPDLPLLFQPMQIRGLTIRNRIVVSPMCQYSSEDGTPTDWHLVHLGQFAMGGAGIVFCEETAVVESARKTYHCAGIYTDKQVKAMRRITDFIRARGAASAMQLGHAGRKAACKAPWDGFRPLRPEDAKDGEAPWQGISSSPVPVGAGAIAPKEMDRDDIRQAIEDYRVATLRTLEAGFDICEVHGAHGYLIQQFLSPIVNHRTDGYGGDLQGRMRFGLELVEAVRAAWPKEMPLFFRTSAVDGKGGHWDINDTVALAKELKARGVDVVDTSSGGINGPLTVAIVPRVPGYHVPYAERIRKEADITTMVVGLITEARHAEAILQEGKADLVALARELMWNPYWPVHAAKELGVPDYLDLLPRTYGWWLQRREDVRRIYPTGTEAEIPMTR
ncbi:MAG: NADH:flavin oxidoreductase/NADH oxidase [Alphaproteobacteria bacterium]|nr:NADH:flavin oxidoreductase/NADH oxidase [Alphaproteobacteria bacterium]